jgi:hypothetical protein
MKYIITKRYKDVALDRVFNVGEEIDIKNTKRVKELKQSGCIQKKNERRT